MRVVELSVIYHASTDSAGDLEGALIYLILLRPLQSYILGLSSLSDKSL